MHRDNPASLWSALSADRNLSGRFLSSAGATIPLTVLIAGSCLEGDLEELRGQSVLVATTDHFLAALAAIELDGIARRIVLYPADFPVEHMPLVTVTAEVDAIVSDRTDLPAGPRLIPCDAKIAASDTKIGAEHAPQFETEWILLTSGTTGQPKLVAHTLSTLTGAIEPGSSTSLIWSTFYDIRRYGGLQIFLRAILGGGSLVLSSPGETTADFLARAGASGVTHISGTPTHWRHALMSPLARGLEPQYVRLSGEIADQSIIDSLRSFYPDASIAHAFASTEAGLAFDVRDGLAGFPASLIANRTADVEMKVEDGSLWIRSTRAAARYLGEQARPIASADGFIDTGDMVELRGDRYYFVGRRDGVINVGGLKVHPEEVESVINRHPDVRMSLVRSRKNPLTGSLVIADVVLNAGCAYSDERVDKLEHEILWFCRGELSPHKVPTSINFVSDLTVAGTGKIARRHA